MFLLSQIAWYAWGSESFRSLEHFFMTWLVILFQSCLLMFSFPFVCWTWFIWLAFVVTIQVSGRFSSRLVSWLSGLVRLFSLFSCCRLFVCCCLRFAEAQSKHGSWRLHRQPFGAHNMKKPALEVPRSDRDAWRMRNLAYFSFISSIAEWAATKDYPEAAGKWSNEA